MRNLIRPLAFVWIIALTSIVAAATTAPDSGVNDVTTESAVQLLPGVSRLTTHTIDLAQRGKMFSLGVRGIALSDGPFNWGTYGHQMPDCIRLSEGSSTRGVAGGLFADMYDWRNRVSTHYEHLDKTQPRPPTIEFLRWARDNRSVLFITANIRGLAKDAPNSDRMEYYTTDTQTLAQVAADWVRYTNRIVQQYRLGDKITDERDAAILNSLIWESDILPNDHFDKLLKPGEPAVQKVVYWEIGNEPNVKMNGSIGMTTSMTLFGREYHDRYKALVEAMKKEDPTIKVGPCVINGTINRDQLQVVLADHSLPVDYISYHPYQKLGDRKNDDDAARYLGGVYANQLERWQTIRNLIKEAGREPDKIELAATEVNVSDWRYAGKLESCQMAHALGSLETIFSFARLGLTAGHYWIWPTVIDGTPNPFSLALEKLCTYMGNEFVDVYIPSPLTRVYTTRDHGTSVAIWAMNFSNSSPQDLTFDLKGLPSGATLTRMTLEATSGTTTLRSANLSPTQVPGGKHEVEWMTKGPLQVRDGQFAMTVRPATIDLLVLSDGRK